jgi:hypothetical protein
MSRALCAGVAYGLILLAAGTLLGTVRVLVAAPRLGAGWALVLELPLMLAVAWAASGWLLRRFRLPPPLAAPGAMSAAALLLLFAGEAVLAAVLTGTDPTAWLAGLARPAAWPGLAAQIAAGLLPILQRVLRRRAH